MARTRSSALAAALQTDDLLEPAGERQRYASISNRKVEHGYGRWLTHLVTVGQLDRDAAPADRIVRECVAAYVQALKTLGKAMARKRSSLGSRNSTRPPW